MFADGVGLAVDIAAFHATAGQPPRKHTGMMPAPGGDGADLWRAAELRRHDHERAREETALMEICEEGGHRLIHRGRHEAHGFDLIVVRVPVLIVLDLDEAHAGLD